MEQIEELLEQLPNKPGFDQPKVPTTIAETSDSTLMNIFVRLTRWADYIGAQFAVAEVQEQMAETALKLVKVQTFVVLAPGKGEVTMAEAQRDTSPEVRHAQAELDVIYAKRKMLGVMYANCDRNAALVSRELTRRLGRNDRESRADRYRP